MFSSSTLTYKRLNMHLSPPVKGPLVTLLIILIIEVLSQTLFEIPTLAPLFVAIAYAAFHGGLQSGLISAGMTIVYSLYNVAIPGTFLQFTDSGLTRVTVLTSTALMMAVVIGGLKRRAEQDQAQALRSQLDQMLLLQHVNDAIIATDPDGRIQTWNRASEMIYGWTAAEVRGKSVCEMIPPLRYLDGIEEEQALALLKQRAFWKGQIIQAHRNGREVAVEASIRLIHDADDGIVGAVAVNRDVTEYRQAQMKREQIERSQNFLAEASNILVASLDYESTISTVVHLAIPHLADWCVIHLVNPDGTLQRPAAAHANPALEDLIRELQRRNPIDLNGDGPISTVLRTGEAQLVSEVDKHGIRAVSPDEYHYQALRELGFNAYMIVPIVARGRTLGAATFVSATRRYTTCDLAEAKELMCRCGLAVDNARLYREAQEAIQTRDQLILIVSHDLKNPLSAIKGHANFLQRRVQRLKMPEAEWLEDSLARIDATTKKMTALLNEMLDFARLQAGQSLDLDQQPIDLVAMVNQVATEYQQAADRHQISVCSSVAELVGQYDTERLERVLANLLSNASKYSPPGGEIAIRIEQVEEAARCWAVIKVQDWGIGIPEDDLPHIFEPFHRAGNVVGRVRGTGIGLTSARQIVEQHGGTLTVVSVENLGSTFTMRLPLIAPADQEALD